MVNHNGYFDHMYYGDSLWPKKPNLTIICRENAGTKGFLDLPESSNDKSWTDSYETKDVNNTCE